MKYSKCCTEAKVPSPPQLSWSDIHKEEGVYIPTNSPSVKLVVVRRAEHVCVLYVGDNVVDLASSGAWGYEKFIKTNLTLCLGFK